ncbi:MAG: trigger factor [Lachnospiraceae bacterium]|nr:trigger factor [Lachnospiraceae bacterium]
MKNKIVTILVCLCVGATVFAGCGSKKDSAANSTSASSTSTASTSSAASSTSEIKDDGLPVVDDTAESLPISDYITLGEYKGLKLTKTITEVTDQDVEDSISDAIANTPITEGAAEKGDTVYIAYVGKVDGKEFDGGTSEGSQLTLGSGSYIPGFEDGVAGMTIGETKELNLTFPDPYENNPDYSGKAVVFSVTLNSITRPFTELTEDWVKTYTDYKSIDEYRAGIRSNLEADAETTATNNLQSSAWQAISDGCTVLQYQQSKIDSAKASIEQTISYYASMAGTDLAGYKTQMGYTDEQYDAMLLSSAKESAKAYMAVEAIAEKEGFKEDDQGYKDLLAKTMEQYNTATEDELYQNYGEDVVKEYIARTRVMNLVIDSADITEKTVSEEDASASSSSSSSTGTSSEEAK